MGPHFTWSAIFFFNVAFHVYDINIRFVPANTKIPNNHYKIIIVILVMVNRYPITTSSQLRYGKLNLASYLSNKSLINFGT